MVDAVREAVLGRTLTRSSGAGGNLRGQAAQAAWLYALPRLAYDRVLVVGAPPAADLLALQRAGRDVTLVETSRRRTAASLRAVDPEPALRVVRPEEPMPRPELLVITRRGSRCWPALCQSLLGRVGGTEVAVVEGLELGPVAQRGQTRLPLLVTPLFGAARTAVPASDAVMAATLDARGLTGASSRRAVLVRAERAALASDRLAPRLRREATVRGAGTAVPTWLTEVAASAGVSLDGWRWGVAARGDYDSQKVLLLLAGPGSAQPGALVKVTRSPVHAARLEQEHEALLRLAELPGARGVVPEPWFAGSSAGRAVTGQSLEEGVPLDRLADWRAHDGLLAQAASWLTSLAVDTRGCAGGPVGPVLVALLDRWEAAYGTRAPGGVSLRARLTCSGAVPTVFQHGDPGVWNILAGPRGPVFLDWESAEEAGLPVWDVMHLFRSYAVAAGARAGERDEARAAVRLALHPSGPRSALRAALGEQRRALGLDADDVVALLCAYWLHRSLKELGRMRSPRVHRSPSARVLARVAPVWLSDPRSVS